MIKKPPANAGDIRNLHVRSLGQEDPWEEGMAIHSSILAWKTPWTEEPGGLQSIGSQSQTRLKRLSSSSSMQYLRPTYSKKLFVIYLKLKFNWDPVFYVANLIILSFLDFIALTSTNKFRH